jgi:hypothetical protein
MKNIIVQIFVPKKGWLEEDRLDFQNDEVLNMSIKITQNYAKQYGCDYKFISKPHINYKHPTWERFLLFEDRYINNFDNILYLDTDVFPWPSSPNIFDFVDNTKFNVAKHVDKKKSYKGLKAFNAGVFCINKNCATKMRRFISKEIWDSHYKQDEMWEDSKELHELAFITNIDINYLDEKWNFKNHPSGYFTHLWGQQKKFNPNLPAIIKAREIVSKLEKI